MSALLKSTSLAVVSIASALLSTTAYSKEPAIVQIPKNSSLGCQDSIKRIKTDLARRGYFIPWETNIVRSGLIKPQVQIKSNIIQDNYYNYPASRTETVIFKLSGDSDKLYLGFMSSPKLMATLGAQIMSSCDRVGLVHFSHWWEGYVPVGYFPDGTARTFTWTDWRSSSSYQKIIETPNGSRSLNQWGYYFSP